LCAAFALLGATLFVVAYYWDTHRFRAIAGVTIFYAAVAAAAWWRAAALRRAAPGTIRRHAGRARQGSPQHHRRTSRMNADELAARKALLVAQAELERIRLTLAVHDVRAIVSPPRDPARAARMHPAALRIVKMTLPLLGLARLSRVVRVIVDRACRIPAGAQLERPIAPLTAA
jgi:hypothetical protein